MADEKLAKDGTRRGRPAGTTRGGPTPKRNIRIGSVWDEAAEIAAGRGETMTTVVEQELQRYIKRHRANRATQA